MRRLLVLLALALQGCLMPDGVSLGVFSGDVRGTTSFDPNVDGGDALPEFSADTDLEVQAAVVTFSWDWTARRTLASSRRTEARLKRLEVLLLERGGAR